MFIFQCTVHSLVETGVAVKLSQTIKGIIPNIHLANSTFKSRDTKAFTEGKQLKCRVICFC
jgi:ribosomal protein S1